MMMMMMKNGSEHCHNIGDTLSEQANYHVNSSFGNKYSLIRCVKFLNTSVFISRRALGLGTTLKFWWSLWLFCKTHFHRIFADANYKARLSSSSPLRVEKRSHFMVSRMTFAPCRIQKTSWNFLATSWKLPYKITSRKFFLLSISFQGDIAVYWKWSVLV